MASYSIGSVTSTSFVVSVSVDSAYPYWRIWCRLTSESGAFYNQVYNTTGDFSVTISGLSPSTSYTVNVGYDNDGVTDVLGYLGGQTVTTKEQTKAPDPWSWTSSNGAASDAQTVAAYNAITGNGAVSSFSYLVWNDLCSKVKATIDAAKSEWYTNGGDMGATTPSYEDTLMTEYDKDLTAARFNAVRFNIGSRASTGISAVLRGKPVYGWYFTTLTNSLNTWINTLSE